MPYYLTHPEHGTHICYTPEDVKAHEAIGWKPANETKAESAPNPERKKPGRPPKVK